MGILRQYLVENFGLTAARAVLTQFGFAHGWRMAAAMQKEFEWTNNEDWRRAGPRIYTLEGLFRAEPGSEACGVMMTLSSSWRSIRIRPLTGRRAVRSPLSIMARIESWERSE